ncbi:MAG TPA: asparagine synthase (glutamine-hydrolyzing) [Pirellulales bacterium]|jgi:asparagine synthase (glutamine-hydrolysing)|nr:asparagine synthase (glutamine-hydrolyzing) [Pirellulales bacterium]
MCGICGVFGIRDESTAGRMLDALAHRGPDDRHLLAGDHYTLGATRLAIVDLVGGRQPMTNESGDVLAAQNGEIYNYPDLRARLTAGGHQLRTHCDTECLPHLYEDYGHNLVEHIDGMFAVSLWDERRQVGLLARDRMGKKPLYYFERGDALYYASELKALLCVPGFERRLNLEALHHFLSYKHVPHPLSIFRGVSILPPAHRLIFRPGQPLRVERYWNVRFQATEQADDRSEEDLVDELLELLKRGVKRRLMADVPIGFFLSGGVDSALSTALAAEMSPGRIKTFTLTYAKNSGTEGKEQDTRWARWTANRYGTEHHEQPIEFADFPQAFRRILTAFDEPFSGVVSTYFLAELIGRHVKVALAGDGADELFGSYLSHRLAQPLANYDEFLRTGELDLVRPFEDRLDELKRFAAPHDWLWRSKLFVFSDEEKRALYHPDLLPEMRDFDTTSHLRQAFAGLNGADALNRILDVEFRTIFPDQVLTFVDRLSMAHSLEVRSAFLDTDFVEFAAGLPARWKIRGGETKYLLKQAARRYLPDEMIFRPKEGFVLPINGWLLNNLRPYVLETLAPDRLAEHGLLAPEAVAQLLQEFYAGRTGHANKILSLVAFQEWYSLYMNDSLIPGAPLEAAYR